MRMAPFLTVIFATLLGVGIARAQEEPKDCPYFSAMPNYELGSSEDKEFDAHSFFNGKGLVSIEGKLWSKYYSLKEGATQASELQITRNYANALKAIGGTVYIEGLCEGEKCGDYEGWKFVSGKASKDGKEIWLEVAVYNSGQNYQMTVVEREAMKQDVSASGLLAALNAEGHVAIYINFDTNRADIKPESRPVIDQVVAMLKENPGLSLSVEGHTDTTGAPEKNKVLSQQRAKAVVTALVGAGIDAKRLSAVGLGQEKPIADNSSEEGRAKNRRVELVKR